jgi:nitronate monooxygenase
MKDQSWRGNPVCELLGCSVPVVLAGMGGVARSELVSAVTAAGGFGFLGMVREPVALIEREVGRVRDAGHRAFGVNIIPAATDPALLARQLDAIIALEVPAVELFWDIDTHVIDRLRAAGITVVYQVGAVGEAIAAQRAGAQIVVAQGVEAGGHVRGVVPLRDLLPGVVRAVRVPVLAAGGLAQGGDMTTAMALGAQGVVLGTALMATPEAFAHPYHQQRLVEAQAEDTVLTGSFHINWPANAPVRVLASPVTALGAGSGERQVIGEEEGRPIYLFSTDSPLRSMTGDFAAMALYAGTGVGAVNAVVPAGERIADFLGQAAARTPQITSMFVADSSPVCMADEFSGAYMGHAEAGEIAEALGKILTALQGMLRLVLAERAGQGPLSRPPFHPDGAPIAGWIVLLRALGAEASMRLVEDSAVPREDVQGALVQSAAVRAMLASLLPRMPDSHLRQVLAGLGTFLAAMRPAENRAAAR